MDTKIGFARRTIPRVALVIALHAASARAAVVAEGTYSINAPERREISFRMVLTPTGARITPDRGETLVFSYEKKTALVIDHASRSYFLLPLELAPGLLAVGLGYDPQGLGVMATGESRSLLGTTCGEVLVSGKSPRLTMRSCRATDPGWSGDFSRLEAALGLPWSTANPPLLFVGLPLSGSVDIEGKRPYRAAWRLRSISRDASATEGFIVPQGYRMDLERLLSLQGPRR